MSAHAASHRIRNVSIRGGFLDGAQFELADGLNCFIGARGAGKTTVVELIRYALDALPNRDSHPVDRRRIETLVERNLAGGRVDVTIETKDGLLYVVSRMAGEEPLVLTPENEPTDVTLKSAGVFRADIFSQNEVESIADRTACQLDLLDSFAADRINELQTQIAQIHTELAANAHELLPLHGRCTSLAEELSTLAGLEDRLQRMASAGGDDAEVLNPAHQEKAQRDREQRTLDAAQTLLQGFDQQITEVQAAVERRIQHLRAHDMTKLPPGPACGEIHKLVGDCLSSVDWLLRESGTRITTTLGQLQTVAKDLSVTHKQQELAFRALMEKHQQAQGQAAERSRLERRRNELLAKRQQQQETAEMLEQLRARRTALLEQLSQLLDTRFAVRHEVAERINAHLAPAVRVSVLQYGNPERYQRLLEEALRNARIKHLIVAQRLANAFWPADLAELIRRRDAAALIDQGELNPEQADKVLAALHSPSVLYELETIELLDLPRIELRDGDTYKDSLSLSTGQKCTAILPILLLDSDTPLLVDQPEDNLDNRFIFEAVVDSIRKVKTRRQLVFVTHNPNIPVLGDAERVFVLDSNGTAARKTNEGTVDQCKTDIVTLLEGGEDAFKARKCRYAY